MGAFGAFIGLIRTHNNYPFYAHTNLSNKLSSYLLSRTHNYRVFWASCNIKYRNISASRNDNKFLKNVL